MKTLRLLLLCCATIAFMPVHAQVDDQEEDLLKELNDKMDRDTANFTTYAASTFRRFYAYLDSLDKDYAQHLAKQWKPISYGGIVHRLRERKKLPVAAPDEEAPKQLQVLKGANVVTLRKRKSQPMPPLNIKETSHGKGYHSFEFYGTPLHVRWGRAKAFRFQGELNSQEVARAYNFFSKLEYKNLLYDCLMLRKQFRLCDWAYYQMLGKLGETIFGRNTNEAVFMQGMLFGKSGYAIRYAIDKAQKCLHLLCSVDGVVINNPFYTVDGQKYYLFEKTDKMELEFCPKEYKGEQLMSLEIGESPQLKQKLSDERMIRAKKYSITVRSRVNHNLIDFYASYPSSYKDEDIMTRWAYYAETPASKELREIIYPQLRSKLTGLPPLTAANMLLRWVQPPTSENDADGQEGLPYGYDDSVWNIDRAFFAEETLYYPLSDCEDHAILFSRLVRDLLKLDVALVYYPKRIDQQGKEVTSHLATAICFESTDIKGTAYDIDGRAFVVADPTMPRGMVGVEPLEYRDIDHKLVKLKVLK